MQKSIVLKGFVTLLIMALCPGMFCQILESRIFEKVKPEEAKRADDFKKKYPTEGIVYLESSEEISFSIVTIDKQKQVAATNKMINDAIIIKDNFEFDDALYYT